MAGDCTIRVVPFACTTTTGTQDIVTSGVGTAPVGAIIIVGNGTTLGTEVDDLVLSVGATDGTRQGVASTDSQDALATSNASRWLRDDRMVMLEFDAEAVFDSFITNGIRIEWAPAPSVARLGVAILFFGADTSCHVGTADNGGGAVDVTAPGFEPDAVVCFSTRKSIGTGSGGNGTMSLGFAVNDGSDTQKSLNWHDETGVGTSQGSTVEPTADVARNLNDSGLFGGWHITGFDASGFSINQIASGGIAGIYVALKFDGCSVAVEQRTVPGSTGIESIATPGFKPQFGFSLASRQTSWSTHRNSGEGVIAYGVGAFDSSNQRLFLVRSQDAVGTTNTGTRINASSVGCSNSDNSGEHRANLSAFDADGFDVNWVDVDTPASSIWTYLVVQENQVPPPFPYEVLRDLSPPRRRRRVTDGVLTEADESIQPALFPFPVSPFPHEVVLQQGLPRRRIDRGQVTPLDPALIAESSFPHEALLAPSAPFRRRIPVQPAPVADPVLFEPPPSPSFDFEVLFLQPTLSQFRRYAGAPVPFDPSAFMRTVPVIRRFASTFTTAPHHSHFDAIGSSFGDGNRFTAAHRWYLLDAQGSVLDSHFGSPYFAVYLLDPGDYTIQLDLRGLADPGFETTSLSFTVGVPTYNAEFWVDLDAASNGVGTEADPFNNLASAKSALETNWVNGPTEEHAGNLKGGTSTSVSVPFWDTAVLEGRVIWRQYGSGAKPVITYTGGASLVDARDDNACVLIDLRIVSSSAGNLINFAANDATAGTNDGFNSGCIRCEFDTGSSANAITFGGGNLSTSTPTTGLVDFAAIVGCVFDNCSGASCFFDAGRYVLVKDNTWNDGTSLTFTCRFQSMHYGFYTGNVSISQAGITSNGLRVHCTTASTQHVVAADSVHVRRAFSCTPASDGGANSNELNDVWFLNLSMDEHTLPWMPSNRSVIRNCMLRESFGLAPLGIAVQGTIPAGTEHWIEHNTLVDTSAGGGSLVTISRTLSGVHFRNNLGHLTAATGDRNLFSLDGGATETDATVIFAECDHNLLFNGGAGGEDWASGFAQSGVNLATWQANTPFDDNSVSGSDPQLVAPGAAVGSMDLHLGIGSAAEDAGLALVHIDVDFDGHERVGTADIGADDPDATTPPLRIGGFPPFPHEVVLVPPTPRIRRAAPTEAVPTPELYPPPVPPPPFPHEVVLDFQTPRLRRVAPTETVPTPELFPPPVAPPPFPHEVVLDLQAPRLRRAAPTEAVSTPELFPPPAVAEFPFEILAAAVPTRMRRAREAPSPAEDLLFLLGAPAPDFPHEALLPQVLPRRRRRVDPLPSPGIPPAVLEPPAPPPPFPHEVVLVAPTPRVRVHPGQQQVLDLTLLEAAPAPLAVLISADLEVRRPLADLEVRRPLADLEVRSEGDDLTI